MSQPASASRGSKRSPRHPEPVDGDLAGKRIGRFRIVRRIGRGAMGAVLLARDITLKREVALKLVPRKREDPKQRMWVEQFIREARSAAQLVHPHIVQIFEVGASSEFYYIAMEVVSNGTLEDLVRRHGPLECPEACELGAQAADALAYAHEQGVIHRDLKPANLLRTSRGHIKLADFGLVHVIDPDDQFDLPFKAIGTPYYMAPEMAEGRVSPQSDIFGLGAVVWYLLTGSPPFDLREAKDVMRVHVEIPLPDLRELRPDAPPALVAVLEKALAFDPADRHASAEQFAYEIRQCFASPQPSPPMGEVEFEPFDDLADLSMAARTAARSSLSRTTMTPAASRRTNQSNAVLLVVVFILGLVIVGGLLAFVILRGGNTAAPDAAPPAEKRTAAAPENDGDSPRREAQAVTPTPDAPDTPGNTDNRSDAVEPPKADQAGGTDAAAKESHPDPSADQVTAAPPSDAREVDLFFGLPPSGSQLDSRKLQWLRHVAEANRQSKPDGRRSYVVVGAIAAVSNGNGQIATMGGGEKAERVGDFYFKVEDRVLRAVASKLGRPYDRENTVLNFLDLNVRVTGVILPGRFGPMITVSDADQIELHRGKLSSDAPTDAPRIFDVSNEVAALTDFARANDGANCVAVGTIDESGPVVGNWYFRLEGPGSWVYVTMSREQADAIARKLGAGKPRDLADRRIRIEGAVTLHPQHGVPWFRAVAADQIDSVSAASYSMSATAIDATDADALRQAAREEPRTDRLVTGKVERVFWDAAHRRFRLFFAPGQFVALAEGQVASALRAEYGANAAGLKDRTVEVWGRVAMWRGSIPSITVSEVDALRVIE